MNNSSSKTKYETHHKWGLIPCPNSQYHFKLKALMSNSRGRAFLMKNRKLFNLEIKKFDYSNIKLIPNSTKINKEMILPHLKSPTNKERPIIPLIKNDMNDKIKDKNIFNSSSTFINNHSRDNTKTIAKTNSESFNIFNTHLSKRKNSFLLDKKNYNTNNSDNITENPKQMLLSSYNFTSNLNKNYSNNNMENKINNNIENKINDNNIVNNDNNENNDIDKVNNANETKHLINSNSHRNQGIKFNYIHSMKNEYFSDHEHFTNNLKSEDIKADDNNSNNNNDDDNNSKKSSKILEDNPLFKTMKISNISKYNLGLSNNGYSTNYNTSSSNSNFTNATNNYSNSNFTSVTNNYSSYKNSSNYFYKYHLDRKYNFSNNNNEEDSLLLSHKIIKIKTFYSISIPGRNQSGFQKTNQDNYMNLDCLSYPLKIFGVFDGHGENGHLVSDFLKNYFTDLFTTSKISQNFVKNRFTSESLFNYFTYNNYDFIKQIYNASEQKLKNSVRNIDLSGSTCILVFIFEEHILCSNVGDSRAIMINKDNKVIQLSRDHKPEIKDEKQRVESMGGQVDKMGGYNFMNGPYRVWVKNKDYPGLAMSRSIGDLIAESVGVINVPEIKVLNASDEDFSCKCIVIASDGVWDFISNEKVTNLVLNHYIQNNSHGGALEVYKCADKMWSMNGDCADDITVTVIFF